MVKVAAEVEAQYSAPNAQLRSHNPHVASALVGSMCFLPTQLKPLSRATPESHGSVSSFGFAGTIAHAAVKAHQGIVPVYTAAHALLAPGLAAPQFQFRRKTFSLWDNIALPGAAHAMTSIRHESSHSIVGIDAVLHSVFCIATTRTDADAPLLEAGLDSLGVCARRPLVARDRSAVTSQLFSGRAVVWPRKHATFFLGAVELRNQLQALSGLDLPSTYAFDHPTARQIATFLGKVGWGTQLLQLLVLVLRR